MLTKDQALALLADLPAGGISAVDMRGIIASVYDGQENLPAVEHRVAYMNQVNEAIIGTVEPWDGTGSYMPGDVVFASPHVFLCLKAQASNHPAPAAGTDWAILDYVSQYGTMVDLEMKVHALEARVTTLEAKP